MRDTRAERIHQKRVARERWMAYHKHNGGGDGKGTLASGRVGGVRGRKFHQWVGTENVTRIAEFFEIQEKKERRRARREAARTA